MNGHKKHQERKNNPASLQMLRSPDFSIFVFLVFFVAIPLP
jgi:hypothetical protein